jgi:hypothetical protein
MFRVETFPRKRDGLKGAPSGAPDAGVVFAPWDKAGPISRTAPSLEPTPAHRLCAEQLLHGSHGFRRSGLGFGGAAEESRLVVWRSSTR